MKSLDLSRYALRSCVAAAMLAGCGGSQPLTVPAGSAQKYLAARGPAAATSAYNVLYNFKGDKDGKSPSGDLINVDGTFYGTTELGGNTICYGLGYGCGVVFSGTI